MNRVEILCGAVTARVTAAPTDVLHALAAHLAIAHPAAQYMAAVRNGTWDGKVRFFRRPTNTFATGLVPRCVALLRARGDVDVVVRTTQDVRARGAPLAEHLAHPNDPAQPLTLHAHQDATVTAFLQQKRLIVQVPTGGGKTEIGAECVRRCNRPTLWVVNNVSLLLQTQARLAAELGCDVGCVGDGQADVRTVTVATWQTLAARSWPERFWRTWELLVLDEAHDSTGTLWVAQSNKCVSAFYRLALSATPFDARQPVRNMTLEGVVGPLYVGARTAELEAAGLLAETDVVLHQPPVSWYPTYADIRDAVCPRWRENPRLLRACGSQLMAQTYLRGVVHNAQRTALLAADARREAARGKRVLVLVTRTAHGERFRDALPDAVWVYGSDSSRSRARAAAHLQHAGAIVIASDIWKQGIDIPAVNVVIPAAGGASVRNTLQRIGRGKRRAGGRLIVYDILDGFGGTGREHAKDYLRRHAEQRCNAYRSEGYDIAVVPVETDTLLT